MGAIVFVAGKSGAGKTYSLRNFEPDEVGVFNVNGKLLPFRKRLLCANNPTYQSIEGSLSANNLRAYVVDDSTYLMQQENFDVVDESGYGKFTRMAKNFRDLLWCAQHTDQDTVVYFLHHVEDDGLGGEKLKTIGKMLDNQLCIEGLSTVFIDCLIDADGNHVFSVAPRTGSLAKCPPGMLPEMMDNDLKAVDTAIRDYYGMRPLIDKEDA